MRFGATIYDLLTGRPPFFRGNIQVQLETVIPPKMAERREEFGNEGEPIPDLWEEGIAACLAKRPQDRPQSMGEIATLLGLGAPASGARTFLSPGTGSGGGPGTSSTRAKTSPTDDTATRTDAVPPNPQTTKKAVPGTRGTPYRSSARPTALRDVIPGYLDEPAEQPGVAPPPPATTPTRGKVAEPISPEAPISVPPEPVVEPPVAEAPVQPEIAAVPEPAVARTEEPQPVEEIADIVEVPPSPAPAAAAEDEVASSFEAGPASVEEVVVEPEPEPEPESIESVEEEKPPASVAEIAKEDHGDFPTLFGEPSVLPQPSAEESLANDLAEPKPGRNPYPPPRPLPNGHRSPARKKSPLRPMRQPPLWSKSRSHPTSLRRRLSCPTFTLDRRNLSHLLQGRRREKLRRAPPRSARFRGCRSRRRPVSFS